MLPRTPAVAEANTRQQRAAIARIALLLHAVGAPSQDLGTVVVRILEHKPSDLERLRFGFD